MQACEDARAPRERDRGTDRFGAGIYLLAQWSETGPTWLEAIAHGSGAFFIACVIYMIGSAIADDPVAPAGARASPCGC